MTEIQKKVKIKEHAIVRRYFSGGLCVRLSGSMINVSGHRSSSWIPLFVGVEEGSPAPYAAATPIESMTLTGIGMKKKRQ